MLAMLTQSLLPQGDAASIFPNREHGHEIFVENDEREIKKISTALRKN